MWGGLGPSFVKIWTCGSFPRSGSRNTWTRIKNVTVPVVWVILEFFGSIQMISFRDWWLWTKPGYITMTRRQSNNHWSGGIAAHPAQKNSECKNPLENFSPRFLVSRRHPPYWVSTKGPNYQRGVLLISAAAIGGHLKEKPRPREGYQRGLVFAR